jgi:hypothetical protein
MSRFALNDAVESKSDRIKAQIEASLRESGRTPLTDIQRAEKEADVAKFLLRGYTLRDIAAKLDIPPSTAGLYAKKIQNDWRADASKSISEFKAKELAKLDHLEEQAWDAWERSKQPTKKQQLVADVIGDGDTAQRRPKLAKSVQEERVGEAKYLDIVFKCISARAKLLGMEEIEVREGRGNTEDELAKRRAKYRGILAQPAILLTGGAVSLDDSGQPLDSERSPRTAGGVSDVIDAPGWTVDPTA